MAVARTAFSVNPTGDFNWLPLISLIAGRRLRRIVREAARALTGGEGDVEDLWKNCYCVASNYTQAREQVLDPRAAGAGAAGQHRHPRRAAAGAAEGDLLCDGGTFNNFPVDVMRRMRGVGQVIRRGPELSQAARRSTSTKCPAPGRCCATGCAAAPAALQAAVAGGLPDERDHPVQQLAPAPGARADRPVLQPAAGPRGHARVVTGSTTSSRRGATKCGFSKPGLP
jgi:predicted acylesterase/phospholipase RssA